MRNKKPKNRPTDPLKAVDPAKARQINKAMGFAAMIKKLFPSRIITTLDQWTLKR